MANLASTYRNQGRWKEAEELDVQVMETSLKVLGQEHPDTLTSMAREVSGTQLRDAISARSNFGLGFALTHILIKSDESHRRKSIFDLAVADFDLAAAD